jgi:acyl-CoA hydrolase
MENHVIVRTEHMNHQGSLFGGQMLVWVDESAGMTVMIEFPGMRFVTRGFSQVEFRKPVLNGSILKIVTNRCRVGKTSITYHVEVYARPPDRNENDLVFETEVTYVAIDDKGNKITIPSG